MIIVDNILDIEKYLSNIALVIFDLDDTLYLEKDYVKSGYDELGKTYPNIKDFSARLWGKFVGGKKAIDEVLLEENLLNKKEECLNIYRNHFPKIKLINGVFDMLLRIKKTKKLAMITDGRVEGQNNKIDALGIRNVFDKIIITDELGGIEYRKPNSKAFEIMQQYFDIEYEKIVYIGDNISKDFIAPEKLGMKIIYFKNMEGLYK